MVAPETFWKDNTSAMKERELAKTVSSNAGEVSSILADILAQLPALKDQSKKVLDLASNLPDDLSNGISLLEVAHKNNVPLEGACEGSLACSTCHVIIDEAFYGQLPPATDDEEDMLDLAAGACRTSRLACQIDLTPDLDGLAVRVPADAHDARRL